MRKITVLKNMLFSLYLAHPLKQLKELKKNMYEFMWDVKPEN